MTDARKLLRTPRWDTAYVVPRALAHSVERREVTLDQIEAEIAPLLPPGGPAARYLATTWAAVLYSLAAHGEDTAVRRDQWSSPARPRRTARGRSAARGPAEEALTTAAIERLRRLGPNRRRELVQLDHHSFRGPAVGRSLLAEARAALPGSPDESANWAELAVLAVGIDQRHLCRNDGEQAALGMIAELYQANSYRCRGDLDRAEVLIDRVVAEARESGCWEPRLWAEAKWFLASLRRDQRRFAEALQQAHLAAALWEAGGEPSNEVRVRWQIATIHEQLGEPERALSAIREAAKETHRLDDADLKFGVAHAEAVALARCGFVSAAGEKLAAIEPEYAARPQYEGPRLGVLALVLAGQGRAGEAQAHFGASRAAFLAAGKAYDAALVTLDWSLFLLDQKRPEEVLPLALSMGQAFEALGVARETLASWAIFQTAAERRELTRAVAETMVRTLGEERVGAKSST